MNGLGCPMTTWDSMVSWSFCFPGEDGHQILMEVHDPQKVTVNDLEEEQGSQGV